MSYMNLLTETTEIIEKNGKTTAEVLFISDGENTQSWEEFASEAKIINYDNSFTGEGINLNLVVAGKDWWLERHEHYGSKWWEFKTFPIRPTGTNKVNIKKVKTYYFF